MNEEYIERQYDEIIKCRTLPAKESYEVPMRIIKQIIADKQKADIKSIIEYCQYDPSGWTIDGLEQAIQSAQVK